MIHSATTTLELPTRLPQRCPSALLPPVLRIGARIEGDVYRLVLNGECDLRAGPVLANAFAHACNSGCAEIIVDLESCDFMDTTGVHAILALNRELASLVDRELSIVAGPPRVHRVFEVCDLLDVLPFAGDESPAGRPRRSR